MLRALSFPAQSSDLGLRMERSWPPMTRLRVFVIINNRYDNDNNNNNNNLDPFKRLRFQYAAFSSAERLRERTLFRVLKMYGYGQREGAYVRIRVFLFPFRFSEETGGALWQARK